jgi:hypothetical protein
MAAIAVTMAAPAADPKAQDLEGQASAYFGGAYGGYPSYGYGGGYPAYGYGKSNCPNKIEEIRIE